MHESQCMPTAAPVRAESGQRATYLLLQRCKERHIDYPVLLLLNIFKLLMLPVMMYGHENRGSSLLITLASTMDSPGEKIFK